MNCLLGSGKGPKVLTVLNLGTILFLMSRDRWEWILVGDLSRVPSEIAEGVEKWAEFLEPVFCVPPTVLSAFPVHRGLFIKVDIFFCFDLSITWILCCFEQKRHLWGLPAVCSEFFELINIIYLWCLIFPPVMWPSPPLNESPKTQISRFLRAVRLYPFLSA